MRTEVVRTIQEADRSLLLRRRGPHLELVLGNVVLLSSAALETELAFGRLAADGLDERPGESAAGAPPKRVIVGGLGFGATLRGVLEVSSPETEIVVVEKLAAVVDLARAEAAALVAGSVDDSRVTVHRGDVVDVLRDAEPASLSAILLDVDNGPDWASFRSNAALYSEAALVRARDALRPGGIFAVWSGYPADGFLRVLRRAGFVPRTVPLHERGVVRARAYAGVAA
jgi:predicted membrane-bound spermidine synthase